MYNSALHISGLPACILYRARNASLLSSYWAGGGKVALEVAVSVAAT